MKKFIQYLIIAAVVFGILSVGTSWYALNEARSSIAQISSVKLDAQSRSEIDKASTYYQALAVGIGASTYFEDQINDYVDYDKLQAAQIEYAILAIEYASDLSVETDDFSQALTDSIIEAREVLEAYFPDQDYSSIYNYAQLLELESR